MRSSRGIGGFAACVIVIAVGCRDIPAPESGVQSISALIVASPGLVVGDTLRDSLGAAAPLRVIAYDVAGDSLDPQPEATFVVIDTGARIEGGRFLVGETAGTTVHVVGTVLPLQTQPVAVKVTLSPDTIVPSDATLHEREYALSAGDTAIASPELRVTVQHRDATPSGVEAVLVRYTIEKAPSPRPDGGASIVLMNGNIESSRDTTDTGGRAARTARLRIAALAGEIRTDTAIVSASASYRGATIGTVQFTIIYTNTDQQP